MFLDTSRNRSRHWCDMRDCGNRTKVARFDSVCVNNQLSSLSKRTGNAVLTIGDEKSRASVRRRLGGRGSGAARAREVFTGEAVTDVAGEVLTFGICGQEVAIQFWRKIEVAVEFAGAEPQIEHAPGRKIGGRGEHARVQELPMHDEVALVIRTSQSDNRQRRPDRHAAEEALGCD